MQELLHNAVLVDYENDKKLNSSAFNLLTKKGFYKKDWETSPQQTFARAANCYSFGDKEFAQRIYNYASNGDFTFASPVLTNAVAFEWPEGLNSFEEYGDWLEDNVTPDGMPISCFLVSNAEDTKEGLVTTRSECSWLSMMGGGIGVYMGNRSPDEKSTGVMAHLKGYDADALAYKQSQSRRGSIAAYMDITHPEIMSFIGMRNAADGGDANKKCFNLNNAVNIHDDFMYALFEDKEYELIDPKHGATGKFLKASSVWEKIMETRFETGEPYLNFIDTINSKLPKHITNPNYKVTQSNLCNEITLATDANRSAVCCLSSLNLARYNEWKDTNIIADLVRLLDNVLEYFIRLAPKTLHKAIYSAKCERAIGLGTLGYSTLFQKMNIPFESRSAASLTYSLFKEIKEKAVAESERLGKERGVPSDLAGYITPMRNSCLLAVAPNASSSIMVGVSPSIEPLAANCYTAQGRLGSYLNENEVLKDVLQKYGKDTEEVWKSILDNDGSVQHLDFLSEHEKKVFKTFVEISPQWIIELAAIRQDFICQSQSLNLKVPKDITKQEMSDIHVMAWTQGLKGLYYCRSEAAQKTSVAGSGEPLNKVDVTVNFEVCRACEG